MPSARPRVYLAGPEVFLRKPKKAGAEKVLICARHGLDGNFPLDVQDDYSALELKERGYAIFRANERLIDSCDAMIANMTPFRGPNMDVGTAYEIGFMRGRGRPVFGYTNTHPLFFERMEKMTPRGLKERKGEGEAPAFEDRDKMAVEQFGFVDNLMIEGAIHESGATVIRGRTKRPYRYSDLTAFEECVKLAAKILGGDVV